MGRTFPLASIRPCPATSPLALNPEFGGLGTGIGAVAAGGSWKVCVCTCVSSFAEVLPPVEVLRASPLGGDRPFFFPLLRE